MGNPNRVTMKSESSWLCPESQCFALRATVTWRRFSTLGSEAETFKYNMIPVHKRQKNTLRCQHFGIQALPQEGSSLFSTPRGPDRNTNYSSVNEHIPIIVLMTLTPSRLHTLRDSTKSLPCSLTQVCAHTHTCTRARAHTQIRTEMNEMDTKAQYLSHRHI